MRQVIRVVEAAPDNRFDHERWGTADGKNCAAGHCGKDPWFRERGFVTFDGATRGGTAGSIGVAYDSPDGKEFYSFEAIEKFFDLPKYGPASAHALFGSDAFEDRKGEMVSGAEQRAISLAMARQVIADYEAAAQKGLEDIL